ncbi:riboflavin biosynthesis protein RibF [Kingella potus]|uniref:riboflavin biosynthesis protein RibF n=1 Tax=Kingella potus TaxID=265175 RepID=UPI001FD23D67|nr:riboflavin biosynthesis protein RibF [Kingella potus]UOP00692.1 riboflavin biosynthesis protein RibF [Kingella potus]
MKIFPGGTPPPAALSAAVTIGNFDGVHLGHLHILQRLKAEADARGLAPAAVVFEPQPAEFFARLAGREPPPRLTPLRDKLRLLRESGCVDSVRVLRFNRAFAKMGAQDFIGGILRRELDTRYLLVGDDFRFGQGRSGDFALLSAQTDFVTEQTPSILAAGGRASSTAVRGLLQAGRLDEAQRILGHAYTLSGRVVHGRKLGPHAGLPHRQHPSAAAPLRALWRVCRGSRRPLRQAARRGELRYRNPTVEGGGAQKLEVHLIGFSGNLYGERLTVRFLHKLRDEEKFSGLDELRVRIHEDIAAARNWQAV